MTNRTPSAEMQGVRDALRWLWNNGYQSVVRDTIRWAAKEFGIDVEQ